MLTGLNPWTVAAHFLLSMVLVAVATILWLRSREPGVGQPLLRRPFVLLVAGIAAVTAVVLALGTVVTGSGPHSGDPKAGRTGFDPELVSQLHADVVFLLIGLTVALLVALYAIDSPDRVRRAARDLLIVQLAQGLVGYVQYFTDLPIALVLVHMLGAVLITAFTARLVWSVRGPASELPLDSARAGHRDPLSPRRVRRSAVRGAGLPPRHVGSARRGRRRPSRPVTPSARRSPSRARSGRRPRPARRRPRRARPAARREVGDDRTARLDERLDLGGSIRVARASRSGRPRRPTAPSARWRGPGARRQIDGRRR